MKRISVALIDDYVNFDKKYNDKYNYVDFIGAEEVGTHGTYIFEIINSGLQNIMYTNLAVLDSNLQGSVTTLLKALEWCYIQNVDLINMSLGTTNPNDFYLLNDILLRLSNKGTIIIAANSNLGFFSFPAGHKNVISVSHRSESYYMYSCVKGYEISVKYNFKYLDKQITEGANSFASALVSNSILKALSINPKVSIEDLELVLLMNSYPKRASYTQMNREPIPLFSVSVEAFNDRRIKEFIQECYKHEFTCFFIGLERCEFKSTSVIYFDNISSEVHQILNHLDASFIVLLLPDDYIIKEFMEIKFNSNESVDQLLFKILNN